MATINNLQTSLTKTLSYTPSPVAGAVLVVCVASEDIGDNQPITGVDFGGTALTSGATGIATVGSNANDSGIWYLKNPSTSTLTITVTGGETGRCGLVALTLGDIDQASTIDTAKSETFGSSGVAPYTAATSATTGSDNSIVISCLSGSLGLGGLGLTGGTIQADISPGATVDLGVGSSIQTPAGTYSHVWAIPGEFGELQRFSACSVAFKEAAGGGLTVTLPTITPTNLFDITEVIVPPVVTLTAIDSTNTFDISSVNPQINIELQPVDSINDVPSPTIGLEQTITLTPIISNNILTGFLILGGELLFNGGVTRKVLYSAVRLANSRFNSVPPELP